MKKLLALFLTLALLLSVLPMALGVSAAEDAGSGDYAIYFDNSSSNNFWVTQKDSSHLEIGMEEPNLPAGNTYTVEFDVYSLTLGSNVVFGATQATWSTTSAIGDSHQVWKSAPANVNEWTHYSFNVTTTADWKGVMFYVIGDGFKAYIDNLTIKDSQGTVVSSFEPTADDISNKSNCASIVELSADLAYAKNPDIGILIDNADNEGYGELYTNELDMPKVNLPAGKYTIQYDFYALSVGNQHMHYGASTEGYAGSAVDQVWRSNAGYVANEWVTCTFDVNAKDTIVYQKFWIGAGIKGYLDNWQILDESGNVVYSYEGTAKELGKVSHMRSSVVAMPLDIAAAKPCNHVYDNACDATCNLCEEVREGVGHSYTNMYDVTCNSCGAAREASDENKALFIDTTAIDNGTPTSFWFNELGMPAFYNTLAAGSYKVVFDVYPLELPEGGNLFHYRNSSGSSSSNAGWWKGDLVTEEWQTTEYAFTVEDVAKTGNHVFYVYGGFKGYVDNFKVVDSNGNTVEATFTGFADLTIPAKHEGNLRIADKSEIIIPDYAVLVDNSACTGDFGQLYLHEVGMDYSKTYPVGDYTIKFDFYALEIASNKNIVAHLTATGWSGDAFPGNQGQKWLEVQEKVGEWQTISFDITTIKEGQFPWFYIGKGLKGYFDNYQIIEKSTGNVLLNFTPVKADLGKVSKDINTVAKLPDCVAVEGATHTYTDYVSNNDATCTANGTETATCVCGMKDTREIADSKLDHVYENYVSNNDATCTANGTETGTCACGATDTREVANSKLDHTYENYVSNGDATCTANGTETGKCACGATDTREDADSKLDHTYENYVSNGDATCTANGTETGKCVCGDTNTREDVDSKLDHVYDNNCDTDCNVCGGGREIVHTYDDENDLICNVCGICKTLDPTLVKEDGVWYYYENGVKTNATTLVKYAGKWFYVEDGIWTVRTTLVKYKDKWFYIKGGKWNSSTEDLVKYSGKWFYIKNGKWSSSAKTLFKKNSSWFYINKGKWDSDAKCIFKHNGKNFYISGGKWDSKKTTLYKKDGKYYAIKSGKWYKGKNIIKYNGKKYYVNDGYAKTSYSGKVTISGKKYTVKKGIIK